MADSSQDVGLPPPLPPLPPESEGGPPPLPSDTGPHVVRLSNSSVLDSPPPLPSAVGSPPGVPEPPPLPPGERPAEDEEDEDPLIVAQRQREEEERALAEASDIKETDDPALKEFYSEMREVDRENEVNRILGAFKLNPYEQLGLRFDCPPEAIQRQYRKSSLMVHPDKSSHPQAKAAFEVIGAALKDLKDPDKKAALDFFLNYAKEEVLKEWQKATKHDAAVRVASALSSTGKEGVQATYERSPEFHEAWKEKSHLVLARSEWRRRKLTKRIAEEEERAKEEFKQEKQEAKRKREHAKKWEKTRDSRVGSWRDFVSSKSKKSKGGSIALGGLKPPKAKEEDEDKRYIQRAVGEQFRPNQKQ